MTHINELLKVHGFPWRQPTGKLSRMAGPIHAGIGSYVGVSKFASKSGGIPYKLVVFLQ